MRTSRGLGMTCVLVGGVFVSGAGYALHGRVENKEKFSFKSVPEEVLRAINGQQRVYGEGGDEQFTFYFKGDTKALNKTLQELASASDVSLSIILSYDKGEATLVTGFNPADEGAPTETHVEFNWRMELGPMWSTERLNGAQHRRAWDVRLWVSVTGDIKLNDIELPLAFKAGVEGPLERLAEMHSQRSVELLREQVFAAGAKPTSMKIVEEIRNPKALWGGGDSK